MDENKKANTQNGDKEKWINIVVKMLTPLVSSACASIAKVILSQWS